MAEVEDPKSDTMGVAKTLLQNVRAMRKGIDHKTIQAKLTEGNERPKNIKTAPKIRLDKKVKKAIEEQLKSEKPEKSSSSSSKKQLQNGGQRIPRDKSDDGLKAPSSPKKSSTKNSKVQNSKEKKSSKKPTDTKKSLTKNITIEKSLPKNSINDKNGTKKSGSKNLISYETFVENTEEPKIVITNPTSPDLESLDAGGGEKSENFGNPSNGENSEMPPPPSSNSIGGGGKSISLKKSPSTSSLKKSPSKARMAKSQSQSKFNSMKDTSGGDGSGTTSPKRSIRGNVSESSLPVQDARFTVQNWPERPPPHERKQGTIIYPKDITEDAVPFTYSPPGIIYIMHVFCNISQQYFTLSDFQILQCDNILSTICDSSGQKFFKVFQNKFVMFCWFLGRAARSYLFHSIFPEAISF